MTVSDWADWV